MVVVGPNLSVDDVPRTRMRTSKTVHIMTRLHRSQIEQSRVRHSLRGNRVLYYKFGEKLVTSYVSKAFLHIYVRDRQEHPNIPEEDDDQILTLNIQVSCVVERNDKVDRWTSRNIANASVVVSRGAEKKGTWVNVDVTEPLDEWFKMQRNQLGLVITMQDSSKRIIALPKARRNDNGDVSDLPYMEFDLEDRVKRRSRRTVGLTCNEDSRETRCCRYPLTVDFVAFGWDWIIAPKTYQANYCMGECPFAFLQKYPNTHVVHLAAPPGYSGPCCSPRKMSPISLLHFTQDLNIALNQLPAMIVEMCGCT